MARGISNFNPGNIDRTDTHWLGMADDQSADPRFIVFKSPEYGIRAIAKILCTYHKSGFRTIRAMINRWAPAVENDSDSYVDDVAARSGIGPDDQIASLTPAILSALCQSIIRHENGQQPYPVATIEAGVSMALA
jgi:hypothetical protein